MSLKKLTWAISPLVYLEKPDGTQSPDCFSSNPNYSSEFGESLFPLKKALLRKTSLRCYDFLYLKRQRISWRLIIAWDAAMGIGVF